MIVWYMWICLGLTGTGQCVVQEVEFNVEKVDNRVLCNQQLAAARLGPNATAVCRYRIVEANKETGSGTAAPAPATDGSQ